MSIEKNVPEIRFEGFGGEWQEREFSDIATRVSIHHQSTCLPCVEYEDIVAGKGRFNKDIHQKKTFKAGLKFEADDVLFGKLRPYLKNWFLADFEGLAVGDFWVLRADNVASTFLFSLIQTNKFELIANLSAGSKMPRSDWGLVSASCFFVPKNISESNEIGNYFQKLDTLINQHQQKHDKLSSIKKAMLEKMFPKPGETMPEIRFKGFSGEWVKDKLGQVYNFQYGEFNINPSNGGQYPVYGANGVIGGYTRFNAQNSAVIGHMGEYAGSVLWAEGKHFVTYNGTIAKPKKSDFNPSFGFFSLVKMNLKKVCGGSGQPFLSYDALERLDFTFPSEKEQIAIGNYFQKLDALINQHQQQITKLNNIKQACLSKMFV